MIRLTKEKMDAQNEKIRQAALKRHGVKTAAELPEGVLTEALRKREDLTKEEQARSAAYSKRLEIYNHALERYQPLAFAVADAKDSSAETFVLVGGNLKSPGVAAGDRIAAGQTIAGVGESEESPPGFLYFEIRQDNRPEDPQKWLR